SVFDTLMRETKHVTTNTPADKLNTNPIWSKDGKFIVYAQEEAKGTNSNIYIVEVATGQKSLLTPHEGEKLYTANDISPDGTKLLITSEAANDYQNAGLLDIASKQIRWMTQLKWQVSAGNFSPDGKSVTWTANTDGNIGAYIHDLTLNRTTQIKLPDGVN